MPFVNIKLQFRKPICTNILVFSLILGICLIVVLDASAETITLAWDNDSSQDISGHRIYYGTASGNYQYSIDAGNNTSCSISDLQAGETYYFAATTYNFSNIESDYSAELTYQVPDSNLPENPQDGINNQAPVLHAVGNKSVSEGQPLSFTVRANDPDGTTPNISAAGLPGTAAFIDHGNGSGTFEWATNFGNAGVYSGITFTATDAVDPFPADSETITITVNSSEGSGSYRQDGGSQGLISMEAENHDNSVAQGGHQWTLITSPSGHSGSAAMQALPEDYANVKTGYAANSPRLDYQVEFVNNGTHYVWILAYASRGSSNSLHIGLDSVEVPSGAFIGVPVTNNYGWTNGAAIIDVGSPGVHTINLWMRESGTIVDKIVLTTDPGYVPTGAGPPESLKKW